MKILFLTSRYPFPPVGGDKLRAFNFIRHMVSSGHEVHLLALADHNIKPGGIAGNDKIIFLPKAKSYLNCLCGLLSQKPLQVWYCRSPEFQDEVDKVISENAYDLIFCHLIRTAEYVRKRHDIPRIVDMTDAISLNYERVAGRIREDFSLKNLLYSIEKKRVLQYEKAVINSFDRSILVSSVDRDYIGRFSDISRVEVVPNGVDINYFHFRDGEYDSNRIVFAGNMRTVPNSDAAYHFATEIFPLVKKEVPGAKFFIVGADPVERLLGLARKSQDIVVTGMVQDIRPFLGSAVVSVAPMRYGAGIQNKILESMAVGTPVVCSSVGFEGIAATPGTDIIVEDSPAGFAEKVIELMTNRALRNDVSTLGRRLVEGKYSWEKTLRRLDTILVENTTKGSMV